MGDKTPSAAYLVFASVLFGIALFYIMKLSPADSDGALRAFSPEYGRFVTAALICIFFCAAFSAVGPLVLPAADLAAGYELSVLSDAAASSLTPTAGNILALLSAAFACTFSVLLLSVYGIAFSKTVFAEVFSDRRKRRKALILLCPVLFLTVTLISVCLLQAKLPI